MYGPGSRNREKFGSVMGREDLIRSRNKPGIAGGCPDLGGNSAARADPGQHFMTSS